MNEWMLTEELPELVADRFEGFQIAAGPATPGLELGQVTVRLSNPGEVAAAVPHFFGFAPDYSVVLLGLTPHGLGGRAALCHGMRVDLDLVERHPSRFARSAAERMLDDGAVESLILIYPRFGAPAIPGMHQRLSTLLCAQFRQLGPRPLDSLFIAGGRWWSFLCEKPDCCPMEGTAIDPAGSEVAALSTYSGLVVLPSRAALAASLQPYPSDTVERTRAACVALADERARERRRAELAALAEAGASGDAGQPADVPTVPAAAEVADAEPALQAECVLLAERTQMGEATRMAERTQTAECIREVDGRTPLDGRKPVGAVVIRQREGLHDRDPDSVRMPSRGTVLEATRVGDISFPAWPRLNGVTLSNERRPEQPEPEPIDPSQTITLDWTEVRALWQLADRLGREVEGPGWQLADDTAAKLLLGITDVRVRDYLATWCATERAGQAVALAVELARRAVTAEQAAAGYSVAAWASWALGWGAWASLTLERALAAVPDYSLAVLIQTGLARGVGPALVRVASHGTAQRLAKMSEEEG